MRKRKTRRWRKWVTGQAGPHFAKKKRKHLNITVSHTDMKKETLRMLTMLYMPEYELSPPCSQVQLPRSCFQGV